MIAAERLPGVRRVPGALRRVRADLALFESWRGSYADSPRAISTALHEARPDIEQLWVADAASVAALPDWATPVVPGSRAYLGALGAAGHVIANTHLPGYFRKKPGTVYVQTWHGTPLKRIGFDIPGEDGPGGGYRGHLGADVARWDVLLSPNAFSTEVFRRAFRYAGRILETGYPRNDVLRSAAAAAIRDRVRGALGIAPGARAILYAPTWRDGSDFALPVDVGRVGLPGDVWLMRAHPNFREHVAAVAGDGVVDVSGHPDIAELLLAADVLVTDYSSVMFDFAVTGKPMLFFTYDLASYRDEVRGFYFDFEREAPGPLLARQDELRAALADLDAVREQHATAYRAFAGRFCALDDGRASQRVVEALFGG